MAENKFIVGVQGDQIVVGLPMRTARMSKEDALLLAAWLVALSTDDWDEYFMPILEDVLDS
jgi:hypothetical protein